MKLLTKIEEGTTMNKEELKQKLAFIQYAGTQRAGTSK